MPINYQFLGHEVKWLWIVQRPEHKINRMFPGFFKTGYIAEIKRQFTIQRIQENRIGQPEKNGLMFPKT